MVYFLNSLIISFFSIIDFTKDKKTHGRIFAFIICVFLIFFCSIRANVGLDDLVYEEYFNTTTAIDEVVFQGKSLTSERTDLVEPLFLLIAAFGKLLTDEVFILFLASSTIAIMIRYKVFIQLSPYPLLSILIYASHEYYVKDWSQIRAGIASAILLYGLQYLIKEKTKKFVICIVIACGFHLTALLGLPLILFKKVFPTKKKYYWIILGAILLSLILPFKSTLMSLSNFGLVPIRISQYFSYEKYSYELALTNFVIVKSVFLSFIGIFFLNKLKLRFNYYHFLLMCQMLGTVYLLIFREFAILAVRANGLLYVVEPILIVILISQVRQKLFVFIAVFMYSFLWIYYDQYLNPTGILPYKSILQ